MIIHIIPEQPYMTMVNGQCTLVKDIVMDVENLAITHKDGEHIMNLRSKNVRVDGKPVKIRPKSK